MRIEYGARGKPILHITEEERERVREIRNELDVFINEQGIFHRDELDFETSDYVFDSLIIRKFENIRKKEVLDESYDEAFFELFEVGEGIGPIKSEEILIVFIKKYGMLEDLSNGKAVIDKIARVKTLDWIMKTRFGNDDSKMYPFSDIDVKIDQFESSIFDSKASQDFILNLIQQLLKEGNESFIKTVSFVFRVFWIREDFRHLYPFEGNKYNIISTIRSFEEYFRKNIDSRLKVGDIDKLDAIGERTQTTLYNQTKQYKSLFESQLGSSSRKSPDNLSFNT